VYNGTQLTDWLSSQIKVLGREDDDPEFETSVTILPVDEA
jgi:hypothetical protein